jgi:hypothetical protein
MTRPALLISLAFDQDELETVFAMMGKVGAASPASVVKTALWKLAVHLEVPLRSDAFASWRSATEKRARRHTRRAEGQRRLPAGGLP